MLVIHGIWSDGALCLWAEDAGALTASAAPASAALAHAGQPSTGPASTGPSRTSPASTGQASPGRRVGRPSRAPRPHPFAASPDDVAEVIAGLAGPAGELAAMAAEDDLTLWLPGTALGPQASPELMTVTDAAAWSTPGRVTLGPWRLPALVFWPPEALQLLSVLGDHSSLTEASVAAAPAQQAVQGESVRYLAALARLATDLTARGRVLPALSSQPPSGAVPSGAVPGGAVLSGAVPSGGVPGGAVPSSATRDDEMPDGAVPGGGAADGYLACWRPVLSGSDAQRARDLAVAMPPLCRATSADGQSSVAVLTAVVQALTDAAARASLTGPPAVALLGARRGRRPARVPVAERWAAALTSPDPRVEVVSPEDEAEASALAANLAAWHTAAQLPAGPVRTCFRLIEPPRPDPDALDPAGSTASGSAVSDPATSSPTAESPATNGSAAAAAEHPAAADDEQNWQVEFALQSADDPSLVLSAADIWAGSAAGGWGISAGISHPQEELLTGLGRASRLFPELDTELRTAAPTAARLDTAGALRFLRESAPLLSGAGFGVLLPDWARQRRLSLRMTAKSRSAPGSSSVTAPKFGLTDMVDFNYELALGDDALTRDDLAELARLKVPLVRLRGQWVELSEQQLQSALKFLERRDTRPGRMRAADVLMAGLTGTDDDLPVEVRADGWLGDLLSGHADQRLAPARTPASFRGELRPYQERGLAWLAFLGSLGLGGVLADDMGLGKTIQLLALLAHERDQPGSPLPGPTLLVCPMSVVGNWEREAAHFTPQLRVHMHHGAGRLAGEELAAALAGADLVITTYGMVARDADALSAVPWHRVICDEAQNIKNAATRQAQAVRSLPAATRIALTGTPVENRLTDLWSIMEFTSPGLLGPAEKFRTSYAVPIERGGDEEATDRLRRVTGPFILRRLKTDQSIISDLPDKLEMKIWCNLTPEQASLYQATVTDMMAKIEASEGIERRGLVLATMAKLKQVCNHPAHLLGDGSRLDGRSGKLARLEEICDEVIAGGEKALCFTQYAEFGRMLQPHLAARLGCPVLYLHGGTPKKQRDLLVSRFQEETDPAVFILSLKAGGTGLNLTAANHVIHVDRWWNPAVEDQATDRAFRIGQRKDVQVRKFVCVGTVEERIDAMIEEKKALAERIVGTGESWLTELSAADLRKVIALSPEAVSR
jgi:SNF2 family DNA or RNA helicase